jgi:hypothetical protein
VVGDERVQRPGGAIAQDRHPAPAVASWLFEFNRYAVPMAPGAPTTC